MSEYQYYEFQAIDRPLTEEEQAYIHSLSSRVELTPVQAVFTYSYGDFRGDPLKVLEKCFDALLYVANWGSKRLAFRFPRGAIGQGYLMPYYMLEEITLTTTERHAILDISFHEEEGLGWIEGEGLLSSLVLLRHDILRGDLRALYLAWLKAAAAYEPDFEDDDLDIDEAGEDDFGAEQGDAEADEDDRDTLLEPSVPAGLRDLSAPLRAFVEFFDVDADLIAVAAEASPSLDRSGDPIEQWVAMLPEAERNAFLVRVARGEPLVDVQLMRRLREVGERMRTPGTGRAESSRRSIDALLAAAEQRRQRRLAQEREEAERARVRKLEALAEREPAAWSQVKALIERKQARAYDEAVALLSELRDLANHRKQHDRFDAQIDALQAEYSNRPALLERFQKAGLIKATR